MSSNFWTRPKKNPYSSAHFERHLPQTDSAASYVLIFVGTTSTLFSCWISCQHISLLWPLRTGVNKTWLESCKQLIIEASHWVLETSRVERCLLLHLRIRTGLKNELRSRETEVIWVESLVRQYLARLRGDSHREVILIYGTFAGHEIQSRPRNTTYHITPFRLLLIFRCSCNIPYRSASAVGGQPGT